MKEAPGPNMDYVNSYWSTRAHNTVKPVLFACPLFREFCDIGNFAKRTGQEYIL